MEGWIKLHRKVQLHWIWEDDKLFKWWNIILLNVNHEESKFPVGDEVVVCKPGQSFRSIESWTSLFKCSKKTTVKFFKMLKNDGMIDTEILGKGNRRKHLLSVVSWVDYQQTETENYTERVPKTTPKGNPNVPSNKNDKNDKNNIKGEIPPSTPKKTIEERAEAFKLLLLKEAEGTPYGNRRDLLKAFFDYWTEHGPKDRKMRFEKQTSFDIKRRLGTWARNDKNYNAPKQGSLIGFHNDTVTEYDNKL